MKKQKNFYSPWIETIQMTREFNSKNKDMAGFVYFLGEQKISQVRTLIEEHALEWQKEELLKLDRELIYFVGHRGPVWVIYQKVQLGVNHGGSLADSSYGWARETLGSLVTQFRAHHLTMVRLEMDGTSEFQNLGALVGFEMAAYSYKEVLDQKRHQDLPQVQWVSENPTLALKVLKLAISTGKAVNLARHLVNMPPNDLTPSSFEHFVTKELSYSSQLKISVWDEKRLKKEKMNLLLAVGDGSKNKARMIHLSYRPTKKTKLKPLAFVGKGITFDTGGLDLKPSAGMRLMKKDMGGAAAIMAVALWVTEVRYSRACDFYLALAENVVDAHAFRPSDVYRSRSGQRVEIDNTDAEGRLVLADVLDVAASSKGVNEPEFIINAATLTGACRVALGLDIAGLFSNDDGLAAVLHQCGTMAGDLNWRLPLYKKYFSSYSTPFADFKNSGESFGGAIAAGLFLEKFVKGKKWAHLDMYAWADKAGGALSSAGGSGQGVQCLIEFLKKMA